MKSERRHELKTNTLAQSLANLNDFLRKHGGKVLLAVVAICLILVLLNNRRIQRAADQIKARQRTVEARRMIDNWARESIDVQDAGKARSKRDSATEILKSISEIYGWTDDRTVLGQATLLEADMNWQIASWPESVLATTRPELLVEPDHAARLKAAREAYQRILDDFADVADLATLARFGLANVAENEKDWKQASKRYTEIMDNKGTTAAYHELARMKLASLAGLQKAYYLAPATAQAATTQSTTRRAATTQSTTGTAAATPSATTR